MPVYVFIDFFASLPLLLRNTMITCKNLDSDAILEFLDRGWDIKVINNIHCKVKHSSVSIKYMIKSQNFILSFYYQRAHTINGKLVPLDQNENDMLNNSLIDVDVWMNNELQTTISIARVYS